MNSANARADRIATKTAMIKRAARRPENIGQIELVPPHFHNPPITIINNTIAAHQTRRATTGRRFRRLTSLKYSLRRRALHRPRMLLFPTPPQLLALPQHKFLRVLKTLVHLRDRKS